MRGVKVAITPDMTRQAELLAGYGLSDEQIARVLRMSSATVKRRLRAQLDTGRADAAAAVAGSLYREALKGNLGAICWYEKTRLGRREGSMVELSGPGGQPLPGPASVLIVPAPVDEGAWERAVAEQQAKLVDGERVGLAEMRAQQRAERQARRPAMQPAEALVEPVGGPVSAAPVRRVTGYGSFDANTGEPIE